jgi:hypothetical protein
MPEQMPPDFTSARHLLQFAPLPGCAFLAQDVQRVTRAPATASCNSELLSQLTHASRALLDSLPNVSFIHRLTKTDVHIAHPRTAECLDCTRN